MNGQVENTWSYNFDYKKLKELDEGRKHIFEFSYRNSKIVNWSMSKVFPSFITPKLEISFWGKLGDGQFTEYQAFLIYNLMKI